MSPVPACCGVLTKDVVDQSSGNEASSSESGTLPKDEEVPSSSLLVNPVVAPEAEACGSASAAQDEAEPKPWRSWKAESHGKWRCESAGGPFSSSDSAPTLAPAARKRGATIGEASASGRTVKSGSGSSRLPFAQAERQTLQSSSSDGPPSLRQYPTDSVPTGGICTIVVASGSVSAGNSCAACSVHDGWGSAMAPGSVVDRARAAAKVRAKRRMLGEPTAWESLAPRSKMQTKRMMLGWPGSVRLANGPKERP